MVKLKPHQKKAARAVKDILLRRGIAYLAGETRVGKTLTALYVGKQMSHLRQLFVTTKKAIPEAHRCGGYPKPGKRTRRLKRICVDTITLFMSGTPNPETETQLYHQMWVSPHSPWGRYRNFYRWADDYVIKKKRWINGMEMNDYDTARANKIKKDMDKIMVTVSQEEAGFSEFVREFVLWVDFDEAQKRIYNEMDKHNVVSKYDVIATNAADRVGKLSQIASGTLKINDDRALISCNKAWKIKKHKCYKKIAVFYKYRAEREVLEKAFNKWTDDSEKFNNTGSDVVFLGQYASIREGIDLQGADAIYFYTPPFSAVSYMQAKARLQSMNRDRPANLYWVMTKGSIDKYIFQCVRSKRNFTSKYYNKSHNLII